jgi:hypothetical protein
MIICDVIIEIEDLFFIYLTKDYGDVIGKPGCGRVLLILGLT